MSSDESDEYDRCDCCYACGIDSPNHVIVARISGREYCSDECFRSGKKYAPPVMEENDPLTVPVRGKCDGNPINGVASFDMHGTVTLNFKDPRLKGTFVVPGMFMQIVKELYDSDFKDE